MPTKKKKEIHQVTTNKPILKTQKSKRIKQDHTRLQELTFAVLGKLTYYHKRSFKY